MNYINTESRRNTIKRNSLEIPGQVDSDEKKTKTLADTPFQRIRVQTGDLLFDFTQSHSEWLRV